MVQIAILRIVKFGGFDSLKHTNNNLNLKDMKEVLFVIGFILLAMYGFNHDFNKAKAEHKAKIELREIDNKVEDPNLSRQIRIYTNDTFDDIEAKFNDTALKIWGDIELGYVYAEHGVMGTFTHYNGGHEITYSITKNKNGEVVAFTVDNITHRRYFTELK